MKKEIIERLKSPVVWTEIVLLVALLLRTIGVYDMPEDILTGIQDIITIAFSIFASLNNPTNKESF